jgi:hypothetical protein
MISYCSLPAGRQVWNLSEGSRTSRDDSHFCAFADSAPLRLCKEALAALHWKAQKTWIPAQNTSGMTTGSETDFYTKLQADD